MKDASRDFPAVMHGSIFSKISDAFAFCPGEGEVDDRLHRMHFVATLSALYWM